MTKRLLTIIMSFVLVMSMTLPVVAVDSQGTEEECAHEWSKWIIEEEPTCGDTGLKYRECTICGELEEKMIAATGEHDWDDWEITKRATIKAKGSKERTCYECGKVQKKSIAKLKPFAKFKKSSYSVTIKKTLSLKNKVKLARGDSVKKWKVNNKSIATISKNGKLKAKKAGKVKVTVTLKSGKKATCTVKVKKPKPVIVYWVPSGSVYHKSKDCPTLSRSRNIKHGTIKQSGKKRCCKVCG